MDTLGDDSNLIAISTWFGDRGFRLNLNTAGDGTCWADLVRLTTDEVVAPKFGYGATLVDAASRAKERYQQEQE